MAPSKAKESGIPKKKQAAKAPQGRLAAIFGYFKDVRSEFKKVIWPGRAEIVSATGVVLAALVFFMISIGIMDFVFTQLIQSILPGF